ncbi:MAG: hypothetical protein ABR562_06645 [Thermoplasmatota archaeon]|nr:hypothetical protein [Halobacteriales archaeon]
MTESQWKRRMSRRATVMVPLGFLLMVVGVWRATGPDGVTGYLIGSVGCFFLVIGALFAKFAAFGPVPKNVTRGP